jgi:hypothetical protein
VTQQPFQGVNRTVNNAAIMQFFQETQTHMNATAAARAQAQQH